MPTTPRESLQSAGKACSPPQSLPFPYGKRRDASNDCSLPAALMQGLDCRRGWRGYRA